MKSVYLIAGNDGYLKRQKVENVVKSFENAEIEKLDGENLSAVSIVENAMQMSFFEQTKVIVIKDLNISKLDKKSLDNMQAMIAQGDNQAVLIFWQDLIDVELKSAKMKAFVESVKKAGSVEVCNVPGKPQIVKLLVEESGGKIAREAAEALVEHSGEDLDVLMNELAKLLALPDEITPATVKEIAIAQNLAKTYDVAKFVLAGNAGRALVEVNTLLAQKVDEIAILAALSSVYLDVYAAKLARENKISFEGAAAELKLNAGAWRLKNAARDSLKMDYLAAARCIELLAETDFKMKSSAVSKRVLLEQAVVELSGCAR